MIELDKETIANSQSEAIDSPRAINEVLAMLDSTWLDPVVHARPTHYNLATSVVCNIKCVFCPRQTFGPAIDSGFLKPEFYDPLVPHFEAALRTGMFGLGEPFLNKRFFDFVRAAKEKGTYVMTSSHGMSLTPPVIEKILDCGLDELCISFDGATPRTTNFLRNAADFETLVENVSNLIRTRNERGLKRPMVVISFTVSKYNVWEMSKAVRLVKKIGADRLAFSNLVLDHEEHEHVSTVGTRVFDFNLKRALKLAEKLGVPATYFLQIPFPYREHQPPPISEDQRYGCPDAWRAVILEKDGNIKPCCYLDLSLGNAAGGDLMEQLNSKKAVNFRRTFTNGRYINTCKGCGQFYSISGEATREILDTVETKIAEGNFSEAARIMLQEKLRYFRELYEQSAKRSTAKDAA